VRGRPSCLSHLLFAAPPSTAPCPATSRPNPFSHTQDARRERSPYRQTRRDRFTPTTPRSCSTLHGVCPSAPRSARTQTTRLRLRGLTRTGAGSGGVRKTSCGTAVDCNRRRLQAAQKIEVVVVLEGRRGQKRKMVLILRRHSRTRTICQRQTKRKTGDHVTRRQRPLRRRRRDWRLFPELGCENPFLFL
jgi:hypothetical protein